MHSGILRHCKSTSSFERPDSYSLAVNGVSNIASGNDASVELRYASDDTDRESPTYAYSIPNHSENFSGIGISQYHEVSDVPEKRKLEKKQSQDSSASSSDSLISKLRENGTFEQHWCKVFIILTVVIFILIIVLFVFVVKLHVLIDIETVKRKQESNTFCLPCNDLRLGPLEEDNQDLKQLIHKIVDGKEVCCAKENAQTSVLMQLLFKRREKLQEAQGSNELCRCNNSESSSDSEKPTNRIAAHLSAGLQEKETGKPPYTVRNWIKNSTLAHVNGIEMQDSRLIVIQSGLYLVYSQILFTNVYNRQPASNISQALYHFVYRWNVIYPNDGKEMLLKSVYTQCWAENKVYGDYTSYTSSVFKLNAGDHLYVKTSSLDLISRNQKASFFGISKL